MKLVHGKVVGGKVEVEGERLPEGTPVMILAREDEEAFELSPADEAELSTAIKEADAGDFVDGDEFVSRLMLRT